jgi:hypothetical protein
MSLGGRPHCPSVCLPACQISEAVGHLTLRICTESCRVNTLFCPYYPVNELKSVLYKTL